MSRSSMVALAAFIFFIGVHLYYLSTPFVSLEFVYGDSAERLMVSWRSFDLGRYNELMANPLSSLLPIIPLYVLFGFSEFATRLPSFISGVGLAVFVVIAVSRINGNKTALLAAAIILLNPMYWVCGGMAYTDVPFCLFSGGGILFCILALLKDRPILHWPAALLLSLSALIKYNGLVFFALAALLIIVHLKRGGLRYLLSYAILAAVIVLPVYLVIFNRYGFLIHPGLRLRHRPRLDMIYLYLPSYLLWLGLFMGPLLLLPVYNRLVSARRKTFLLLVVAVLLALCVICGISSGYLAKLHGMEEYEMNVGWFEYILGERALGALLVLVLFLTVLACLDIVSWMARGKANLFFGIWLFAILFIGSASRPANRYLLFILIPLAVYLSDILTNLDKRLKVRWPLRAYFAASLIVLAVVCFITTSFWIGARGSASAEAVRYMNDHRLSPTFLDWRVTSHSLYLADESLLTDDEAKARYLVYGRLPGGEDVEGRVLFRQKVSLMGRPVIFYEVSKTGR